MRNESGLVSIVIPTFNRAHLISETLDSILAQTYSNWECIIVDDGSSDNTREIVKGYLALDFRFNFFERPNDRIKGPNSCRNIGYEKSKGEFIHWFDSDDLLVPEAFENYLLKFHKFPDRDVYVAHLKLINMQSNRFVRINKIESDNLIADYLVGKVSFYVSGPMWRRSFLAMQQELFSEDISYLDDWDFNLRMLYRSPKIGYIKKPLILYRLHDLSLTQEIGKLNLIEIKSEIRARKKHLNFLKLNQKADPNILDYYILKRYKRFLRNSFLQNSSSKYYFLWIVVNKQIRLHEFKGMFKTIFGFFLNKFFRKGYKFLK